jgi:hypothetical protein
VGGGEDSGGHAVRETPSRGHELVISVFAGDLEPYKKTKRNRENYKRGMGVLTFDPKRQDFTIVLPNETRIFRIYRIEACSRSKSDK